MPEWDIPQPKGTELSESELDEILAACRKTEDLDISVLEKWLSKEERFKIEGSLTNAALLMVAAAGADPNSKELESPEFWAKMVLTGFIAGFTIGKKNKKNA